MTNTCKVQRLLLVLITFAVFMPTQAEEQAIDLDLARKYLNEAETLCRRDQGRLWGVDLCGPILLVDGTTRMVVANRGEGNGVLEKKGDLFVGKWPVEMNISNTAIEWAGAKWSMMVWPLPPDASERTNLMLHELFHRIQDDLGLPGSNPANSHLDTRDGRIWMQLEWRALANALVERGSARKSAIQDALVFREYRRALFGQAAKEETALEINEGLAEYTGLKISSVSDAEFVLRASCTLRQARFRPTFVRSFAYASGPAYAALLDSTGKNWRRGLKPSADLGALVLKEYAIKLPKSSDKTALQRAQVYNGPSLIETETARDNARQEVLAKYRTRFFQLPVLTLSLTENVKYSFNPNNLIPLDDNGTIYPTIRVSDDWGVLEVSDGALVIREQGRVARVLVGVPESLTQSPLSGPGWKLELKPGWTIEPAQQKGSLILKRN